jgi:hypothetical protein
VNIDPGELNGCANHPWGHNAMASLLSTHFCSIWSAFTHTQVSGHYMQQALADDVSYVAFFIFDHFLLSLSLSAFTMNKHIFMIINIFATLSCWPPDLCVNCVCKFFSYLSSHNVFVQYTTVHLFACHLWRIVAQLNYIDKTNAQVIHNFIISQHVKLMFMKRYFEKLRTTSTH